MKNLEYFFPVLTFVGLLVIGQRVQAQGGDDPCASSPEVIFQNGTILTMDESNPVASAFAITSDTIMAVGSSEDVLSLVGSGCGARIVDLNGLTVLPGFNDAHSHWFSWPEHICSLTSETTYPSLDEIMDMLSANGWTSISELNFGRPDFAADHLNNALDLDARGELSVRLNGYWGTLDDVSLVDVLADSGRSRDTFYSDRVRAPGIKMYVDDPFGGSDILSQEQVNQLVRKAHDAGWQIAAHAVNESAVEKILSAYETVLGPESNANARHRIEHAVKVSDNQLERMKAKGIIGSFQLLGPADWPTQSDFGDRFLGDHPEWVMRWKDFVDAQSSGLKIAGSSDAPFNDAPCNYSPFEIVYQAVTRDGYADRSLATWELNQRIATEDALKLLTLDGAYATSEETQKGSLEVGKFADFTVVSTNPLTVATPADLRGIAIVHTVVGGKTEYCDEAAASAICSGGETFIVDAGVVTASRYLADQTPDLAFDGEPGSNWGSGEHPPQWIQIDLRQAIQIGAIDLTVEQFPNGRTVHEIWAKTDDQGAEFELLHTFDMDTESAQVLTYDAPSDVPAYRFFQIKTTTSPSWVSWREIVIRRASATSAESDAPGVPMRFALAQNYPNPFSPNGVGTTITFELPEAADIHLVVFDALGRVVESLFNGHQSSGRHTIRWEAKDLPGGVYYVRLETKDFIETRGIVLSK